MQEALLYIRGSAKKRAEKSGIKSGDIVYVFDFDDTLFHSKHWTENTKTDKYGLISETDSNPLMVGQAFLSPDFTLAKDTVNQKGFDEYVFRVISSLGIKIESGDLLKVWSKKDLSDNFIDITNKYVDFPAIATDEDFYQNPATILEGSPNQLIFKLYNTCDENRIILTARKSVDGMSEAICSIIKDFDGKEPNIVFTRPSGSFSSGEYKGATLLGILDVVGSDGLVIFYDDNPKYIEDIKTIVSDNHIDKNLIINKVNNDIKKTSKMLEIARDLLKIGYAKYADTISSIYEKENFGIKKESVLKRKKRKNRGKNNKGKDLRDRFEWALVSKTKGRVLKWFGPEKPSKKDVAKEEARIHYFKK